MKIAIDAMGGDFAPDAIVEGVAMAAKSGLPEGVTLVLIGNQPVIEPLLVKYETPANSPSEGVNENEII